MHPDFQKADQLSHTAIAACMEVHSQLGPGLMESVYERCVRHELSLRKIPFVEQKGVPIRYKDLSFEETLRLDLMLDGCLILELKTVETLLPVHQAQLLSYLRLLNVPLGLLINFNTPQLKQGIKRLILPGANTP